MRSAGLVGDHQISGPPSIHDDPCFQDGYRSTRFYHVRRPARLRREPKPKSGLRRVPRPYGPSHRPPPPEAAQELGVPCTFAESGQRLSEQAGVDERQWFTHASDRGSLMPQTG